MSDSKHLSAPVRLVMRFALTILLVYILNTFLDQYFLVEGGLIAILIIASLLTLMNVIIRPVINVIMLPFKLFMGIVALIIANGLFLWLTEKIAERMDPAIIVLHVDQNLGGWLLVALVLGLGNWLMKEVLR